MINRNVNVNDDGNNGGSSSTSKIDEAIEICRRKLDDDPHFTKARHSLARLLDSLVPPSIESDDDEALAREVLDLYEAVGRAAPPPSPSSAAVEGGGGSSGRSRPAPPTVRFESLVRAGERGEGCFC